MITWTLVFYISHGFGLGATGGPAVIDGFTSEEKCLAAKAQVEKLKGFDYAYCLRIEK